MSQQEINNILEELNNGKFHVECPSCYEEVNLKEAAQKALQKSVEKTVEKENYEWITMQVSEDSFVEYK
jgi:hypothetical protein